jgi:serine protease Do
MSRPATRFVGYVATLGLGLGLGLSIGRLAQPVSAQARDPRQEPAAARPPAAGSEEAIYQQLARQYEQFRQVDRTFEQVAKVVSPAVVHIVARKTGEDEEGRMARFEETGSGVIVRAGDAETRYVLTNNHVVEGSRAEDVTIYLHDGRVLKPELFWADLKVDIAVLKLDRTDLPVARLGNSDEATVGSWVLAIGSPFGLTHSVSQGIISARSRYEQELEDNGVENQDFLQTDAAINPGNSGGPLVNLKGEVVGINTAIASNGGGSEGVGFSIPINLARWAMTQLVKTGRVARGAIGVHLMDLDAPSALAIGLDRPRGARIDTIQDGSPAAKAGLRHGDVILKYNGTEVVDYNHLINLVSMTPIGETAEMLVWRESKAQPVKITIADRSAIVGRTPPMGERTQPGGLLRRPPRQQEGTSGLGLEMIDIDGPASARRYGLADSQRGVLILKVEPTGPLAPIFKAFDVIESIDGRAVRSAEEVGRALSPGRAKSALEVVILRPEKGKMERRTIQIP